MTSGSTLQYDSATRTFTISGAFPTNSDFLVAPGPLKFSLTGFTNPASSSSAVFNWADFITISGVTKKIDTATMSGIVTDVAQGVCLIKVIKPTDNILIYGIPGNYTVTAWCDHDITTTDTLKIVFPAAYTVVDNNRCILGGLVEQYPYYNCIADAAENSITLVHMTTNFIPKQAWFTFTIDSLINPGTYDDTGLIKLATYDSSTKIIDLGSYTIVKGYFVKGNITVFTVEPLNVGVGSFPSTYRFTVTPSGEVWEDAYLVIRLPDQVSVWDERALETKCGTNLQAFTYVDITCKVNGNVITINNGF